MKKLVFEKYNNVYTFMQTIQDRPENNVLRGRSESVKGDKDFCGGFSWDEAVKAFENGLPEVVTEVKQAINKINAHCNISTTRARPRNYYYGHAPNVPAAIIGLPKAMKQVQRIPQKVKALSLYYDCTMNAGTKASVLRAAGITVIKLVHLLELYGYRVELNLLLFTGGVGTENALCKIQLKDWKQPLDLLKLSFPVTSPAMFRRFGFKWLETVPDLTSGDFKHGYGSHIDKDEAKAELRRTGIKIDNAYFITVSDCKEADYNPFAVAQKLEISL